MKWCKWARITRKSIIRSLSLGRNSSVTSMITEKLKTETKR